MIAVVRELHSLPATRENNSVVNLVGPGIFDAIHKTDCAAAIWLRRPVPDFQSWIHSLSPENLPSARFVVQTHSIANAIEQVCEDAQTPRTTERDLFINDIVALSEAFSTAFNCDYIKLRLDKVIDNACSKFHKDAITARLVCTYRGTGTQYGFLSDFEEPNSIETVPVGSPLLMRGTLWPEEPRSGFSHRSPPIEGTGETRLVLVLDPIFDPEDAAHFAVRTSSPGHKPVSFFG